MKKNIKITKQQIKEDKFTTNMLKTRDWLLDNWQPVALAAAALIIIIVGISYYTGTKEGQTIEASTRLSTAIGEMRRGNYQEAIVELNDIADNYGGDAAASATFNLANAYYGSKNFDEAINYFQEYLDKYKRSDLEASSAIAGIAACHENKQEFQAAADKYLEAADYYPDSPNAPEYLLGAIRNYINLGNREEVDAVLSRLESEFPESSQYRDAVMLSMKINS